MNLWKELREKEGSWTFLGMVANVTVTKDVNREVKLERAVLINSERLPYVRKRLGLPEPLSHYRKRSEALDKYFFERVETFVVLRQSGVLGEIEQDVVKRAEEEVAILSASQLGFTKRRWNAQPMFAELERLPVRRYLVVHGNEAAWGQPNQTIGTLQTLDLDARWKAFAKEGFFRGLLRILRGDVQVAKGWRKDLRNAAILIGQSQSTSDVPSAFLWNMIALELLLTRQQDKVKDALPERAEALLGWTGYWRVSDYEQRIRDVYQKRCRLVHQGDRDSVSIRDLFFTDDLLLNLLVNLVGHVELFDSKDAVVAFSQRVAAERTLGIETGVRPKTLSYLHRTYSERDFDVR